MRTFPLRAAGLFLAACAGVSSADEPLETPARVAAVQGLAFVSWLFR